MKDFSILADYDQCTGCGACYAICDCNAIAMHQDNEGFLRPVIDETKCVGCRRCQNVCPVLGVKNPCEICNAYAARAKNDDIRLSSTSGGIFSLLANDVIDDGGVVYGVIFDALSGGIIYKSAETKDSIAAFRGSKYVQADASAMMNDVKGILKKTNRRVLFSGTPCQIAGLRQFLNVSNINMEKLLLVDVICHAVSSPLAWERYLAQFEGEIVNVNFRSKRRGWQKYTMSMVDGKGKERLSHLKGYAYLWGFLQSLYNRPSCHCCSFRDGRSSADVTLGDYWGIGSLCPDMDDGNGASAVIVRTKKGSLAWQNVESALLSKESTVQNMTLHNPALVEDCWPHVKRREFFEWLTEKGDAKLPFDCKVKELLGMSIIKRFLKKFKLECFLLDF